MQRVANFLLEMDRRLAHRGMMALPMCRRDYLGLALETASVAAQSSMHFSEGLKTWSPLQFVCCFCRRLRVLLTLCETGELDFLKGQPRHHFPKWQAPRAPFGC